GIDLLAALLEIHRQLAASAGQLAPRTRGEQFAVGVAGMFAGCGVRRFPDLEKLGLGGVEHDRTAVVLRHLDTHPANRLSDQKSDDGDRADRHQTYPQPAPTFLEDQSSCRAAFAGALGLDGGLSSLLRNQQSAGVTGSDELFQLGADDGSARITRLGIRLEQLGDDLINPGVQTVDALGWQLETTEG